MDTKKVMFDDVVKTPDTVFDVLCRLTLNVCNILEFPAGTFTETGNRWLELAAVWDKMVEGGSKTIFLDVVHRAMWGFPYSAANPVCEHITRIVHYELLRDREAFVAWDGCDSFEEALCVPANEDVPWLEDHPVYHCSVDHYEFLFVRMLYKLRFSKRKYAYKRPTCEAGLAQYRSAIGRIIPASKDWTEVQWTNEGNIYNEIQRIYGLDFRGDIKNYHYVYTMLTRTDVPMSRRVFTEAWYMHKIGNFSMSLATALWPQDAEFSVLTMFRTAGYMVEKDYKKTRKYRDRIDEEMLYEYKAFYNSWLYRTVKEWYTKKQLIVIPLESIHMVSLI